MACNHNFPLLSTFPRAAAYTQMDWNGKSFSDLYREIAADLLVSSKKGTLYQPQHGKSFECGYLRLQRKTDLSV